MDRHALRHSILAARDALSAEQRKKWAGILHSRLFRHEAITAADHIFIYVHFRSEVATIPVIQTLLAAGKTVSVPKTLPSQQKIIAVNLHDPDNQLIPGYYGIPEPTSQTIASSTIEPQTIDTVIVPGSVFDPGGGRLGYGGGFYDRFLAEQAPQAQRIALAFAMQMVPRVPVEPHDQFMDYVMTETTLYDCKRNLHA